MQRIFYFIMLKWDLHQFRHSLKNETFILKNKSSLLMSIDQVTSPFPLLSCLSLLSLCKMTLPHPEIVCHTKAPSLAFTLITGMNE